MQKRKVSLLFSVAVGLLAVFTASVSTFAWFQANANVSVQTSSSSTTITVNKPDDYTYYAYNGNQDSSIVAESGGRDWDDDFTMITTSNIEELTTLSGMYPGKAMTFVFVVDKCSSLKLDINEIKSNDTIRENAEIAARNVIHTSASEDLESTLLNRYVSNQATETAMPVNIGWAIDIRVNKLECNSDADLTGYGTYVNNPTGTGSDLFTYNELGTSAQKRANYLAGTENSTTHVIDLSTDITLYNNSTTSSKKTYLFYSVVFSDLNGTYFQEVNGWNDSPVVPKDFPPGSGNRYFSKSTIGNSNCYADLSFALNHLTLTIG